MFCRRDPLNGYNNRALAIESENAREGPHAALLLYTHLYCERAYLFGVIATGNEKQWFQNKKRPP